MLIEIICTGDEILTGKTINTNYSHMARRLGEEGFEVRWGTTLGDDRATLLDAFRHASARADAVIVNGGLGPTIDDLSQEIGAQAAGVQLVLNDHWIERMEDYARRRGRVMPANNRKQAMLPEGAELLDNPIGTACGFALPIGRARFFFTPGVPREMHRMLDEQIVPRLRSLSGVPGVTRLKRFHSFGIGESRADEMLAGVEALAPDGSVKLGFQTHYPQLETKIVASGPDAAEVEARLAPVAAEIRRRLGNFIVAEDADSLEGVILAALEARGDTLATAEMFTGGAIASRLSSREGAERLYRRGIIARTLGELGAAAGTGPGAGAETPTVATAMAMAAALRQACGASLALASLIELDDGGDRLEFGGTILIGIADGRGTTSREARLSGGRDWVRRGATEMGLDCLRRHLAGLPLEERIDFERR